MDEKTVTMMEGVAREWRVRVMDSAGNVLDPEGFSFYGAAADGVQVPRRMQVHVAGDVAVLLLPGLWMSGRCWRYQVLCQDVLTGVEWVLCQGDVVLERRVACNGPALHEDAVLVDAVLDSELEKVEVVLGDSTAAAAKAARLAEAAREGAEAGAARSVDAAAKAEALKGVALDAAAKAALSAEGAGESAQEAGDAAAEAAGCARDAEAKAAEAEVSREAAEAAQRQAAARAAEAEVSAKVAADAASDALAARDEAAAAQRGAEEAQVVAEDASAQAGRYAEQAVGAADGAVVAQGKAEAAQGVAEVKAAEAVEAAEAVLQPGSIAVQAARPAVMVLLREEMERLLGDSASWVIDTDGQKIVVHTDRLEGEQLAAVDDILARYVPEFIGLRQHNHDFSIPWQEVPDGFKVVEWLESVDKQKISVTGVNVGTTEDILQAKCLSPYWTLNSYRYVIRQSAKWGDGWPFNSYVLLGAVHEGSIQHWYGKCSIVYEMEGSDADGVLVRPNDWVTDGNLADFAITPDVPFEVRIERRVMSVDGVPRKKVDANYVFPATAVRSVDLFYFWANTGFRIYNMQRISVETGEMLCSLMCCLDDTGAPCMVDRVSGTVFYNSGSGDFLYPGKEEEATTYSLRRPVMYGQLTGHGVRRLYRVPEGYNGTREEYAAEFGFKPLVETVEPEPVEGVVWEPHWRETVDELVLEWKERMIGE